jgi:SAM-dependent methyltransferase
MRLILVLLVLAAAVPQAQQAPPARHRELFPPQDLGLLEAPDRAAWQKPDQIMDALGIADGAHVADIGAGAGWFTTRLARRVGPNGVVYAQDIQPQMLAAIKRRVQSEGLQNVRTVRGEDNSPNLPPHVLDAILVVDAYPEVQVPDGRIGIVNYKLGGGGPGPDDPGLRVPRASVERDAAAAGLKVRASGNLPYQYLLVLGR